MKKKWKNITKENVIKAIELFESKNELYPKPRNTFLIYDDKKYPAKHIRGLAYKIANNKEILKSEYSGGKETVTFFKKLGFAVEYKKGISKKNKNTKGKGCNKKRKSKKLNSADQKNALQVLLQKNFGIIQVEKRFDWLKTPDMKNLPPEYIPIVSSLSNYRNQKGFKKSGYNLLCDIFLEEYKLIIEYDENQHFSEARKITLENYPDEIKLNYSKTDWIDYCAKINAKDNAPADRDEKRAFYDSVRDIEAYKNNYRLIRIKHGEFDWKSDNADKELRKLTNINSYKKRKIARIVTTGNDILHEKWLNFVAKARSKNYHFEFLITPGGFLHFDIPEKYKNISVKEIENNHIDEIIKIAEIEVLSFLKSHEDYSKQNACVKGNLEYCLEEVVDFCTIGIDGGHNKAHHIELVCVYDTKKRKIVNWTGKFYPTQAQKNNLIKVNNLDTHFVKLNNKKVLLLGCHDLTVFNPRGQAKAKGWKKEISNKFKKLCKEFKPEIVLQHPHTTDTPNTWNSDWVNLQKELPSVKHFASGINYHNKSKKPRSPLKKVLEKTKKGDVIDFE